MVMQLLGTGVLGEHGLTSAVAAALRLVCLHPHVTPHVCFLLIKLFLQDSRGKSERKTKELRKFRNITRFKRPLPGVVEVVTGAGRRNSDGWCCPAARESSEDAAWVSCHRAGVSCSLTQLPLSQPPVPACSFGLSSVSHLR